MEFSEPCLKNSITEKSWTSKEGWQTKSKGKKLHEECFVQEEKYGKEIEHFLHLKSRLT